MNRIVSSGIHCPAPCNRQNICILLLIGIPGSGKSFFRTLLENYFKTNFNSILGTVQVFSVCYDDFSSVRNPIQGSDCIKWKEERSEILKIVENIINYEKNHKAKDFSVAFPNVCVINSEIVNSDTRLVIIDDNMYYRSMRYEYYKLAKAYQLSFCQILCDVTLQEALKYNKQRDIQSQVPDNIIKTMFDRFEPPDQSHSWEKNVMSVKPFMGLEKERILENLLCVIRNALECPVQLDLEGLHKEEAQQITNSNALHLIDNTLKQLVGVLIKNRIKEGSENPKVISHYFSEKRLELLRGIRERRIVLPVELNNPISKEDIILIKPILTSLLNSSVVL